MNKEISKTIFRFLKTRIKKNTFGECVVKLNFKSNAIEMTEMNHKINTTICILYEQH